MPAGQVIGRVSVKVLPDTDDFRRRAERDLDKIEKRIDPITIPTRINLAGATTQLLEGIRKINARNRTSDHRKITLYTRLDVSNRSIQPELTKVIKAFEDKAKTGKRLPKIKVDAVAGTMVAELDTKSLDHIRKKLEDWRDKMSPIKIGVKPEIVLGSTTWVEKRLEYMTRPRTVPIIPFLSKSGAAKFATEFGTMLAALSGARVVKNLIGDFGDFIKTADKSALKIGSLATAFVGLAGWALTAGSNLFALGASLASIASIAITMPATFAAAGIGIGVLVAAFKDFNTVMPEVKSKLSELQNLISGNFWAKAQEPMREMIDKLLPQFSKGLGDTATAFGSFFGKLSTALNGALDGALVGMFAQLTSSIKIAEGAASPLAGAVKTLGEVGASYLPKMATWVVDISTRFNDWLTRVAGDGSLDQWVANGLQALSDLGQVLKNTYGIFSGLAQAASDAGGSSLGLMAQTLERINTAVNSEGFQTGLVSVLQAAHQAITAITTTAGPAFEKFISTLATVFTALLPIAGQAIGTLVAALSTALSDPAFVKGFESLIGGMAEAIKALAPAMVPLAGMLGSLGGLLGTFLASLGPVLGDMIAVFSGMLQTIMPALQPLVGFLTGALGTAFKALAPVFAQIGQVVAQLVTAALPPLLTIFQALMPVVVVLGRVFGMVLSVALAAIAPLFPLIANAVAQIAPLFVQLIAAVAPLIAALLPALGKILAAIIPILVSIATAVLPPVIAAISALVQAVVPVIGIIAQLVVWLLGKLAPVFTFLAGVIGGFVASFIGNFTGVFESIMGIFEGFKTMFSGGWMNFFTGLGQIVVNALKFIWNVVMIVLNVTILGAVKKGLALLKGVFSGAWAAIKLNMQVAWAIIQRLPGIVMSAIRGFISRGLAGIKGDFSLGWNALKGIVTTAWGAVKTAVSTGITNAVTLVKSLPQKAKDGLGNLGSTLKNAASQLIGGFVQGIKDKFGDVKGTLQDLTKRLTDWKGPESLDRVLLVNAGVLVIDGFIRGLESRYDAVKDSLKGLTDDIGGTVVEPPQIARVNTAGAVNSAMPDDGSSAAAGVTNNITIPVSSNASPEDVAEALLFATRRLAGGGVYARMVNA